MKIMATIMARDAPFTTYRCGEVNLIVTDAEWFFANWCGATDIAKRLNLLDKAGRIALFQGVLYGNWDTWLSKGSLTWHMNTSRNRSSCCKSCW